MRHFTALLLAMLLLLAPASALDRDSLSITCIGDSLTEGVIEQPDPEVFPEYAYPTVLSGLLGVPVRNFGSSGAMASEENEVFNWKSRASWNGFLWNTRSDSTSVYVIYLGANDMNWHGDLTGEVSTLALDHNTFVGGYSSIIESIFFVRPDAEVFLVTLGPECNFYPTYDSANQKIRDIAQKYGCHVIDWSQVCAAKSLTGWYRRYLSKAPHLNQAGYQLLASFIRDSIVQTLGLE